MTDLTDVDGVGPSYAADLEDEGYESAEDVADADPEELDGVLPTTSGERLVENAQHATQTTDDDVEGELEDLEDEVEAEVEDEADEDDGEAEDPAKIEYMEFEPHFTEDQENHLIAALVNEELTSRRRNNAGRLDASREAIATVRTGEPYKFTLEQLSIAYTATNQLESEYRGTRGLSSFVSDVRAMTQFFQSARQENWPDDNE